MASMGFRVPWGKTRQNSLDGSTDSFIYPSPPLYSLFTSLFFYNMILVHIYMDTRSFGKR